MKTVLIVLVCLSERPEHDSDGAHLVLFEIQLFTQSAAKYERS